MMCDDIDIEEHDVMQNAKEFYPDISIVKTETLDYEEDDGYEDISYPSRMHPAPGPIVESGLVEVHNADSTTEIQEQPSTSQAPTPTDSQFFGNKIILGFKKKTPDDELQHEPRCFQTLLRLEDCMAMLTNSRRYCFNCQILFPTPNLKYSHEMKNHSHLIEMDESSVSTEISKPEYFCCKLCPSKFTRQFNLNKHYKFRHSNLTKDTKDVCFVCHKPQASKEALIKHLYEKHYNNKMYSCQICSDQFKNKSDLEEHLYDHARSKFKKQQQKPQSESDHFKCNECDLTFVSKYSLRSHLNGYHNKKATNARKISNDANCMFKCSLCVNVFSNKKAARRHFMNSHKGMPLSNAIRKVVCRKSSPSVSTQSTDRSEVTDTQRMLNKHIIGNTIRKALSQSPSVSTDQSEVTEKPAQQLIPKNIIFKCDTCPLCFLNNKDALDHRHHDVPFDTCNKCHLCFPNNLINLHQKQHECCTKFQVISAFPNLRKRLLCKCPQCDIYFMETSLFLHLYYCKRNTKSFYCNVCRLNLNLTFRSQHLNDHAQFNKASDFIFVEYINANTHQRAIDDDMDAVVGVPNEQEALLEKYKSLSTIWNVLYMCNDCSFVVDNYTMVIEHCHDHLVTGGNAKKEVTHCQACGIDFEKITYGRHSKLHKSNHQVTGASFNILSYNYTDLYKKSWRKDLFLDIPEHDVERLVRDSPYKSVRTIKLRVITTGTSQYTLYKCEQCKNVVQEPYVVKHALKKHDAPFRRALHTCTKKCNICHLQFSGHMNYIKHQEMHRKFKIGVNFFTLTSFNSTGDFQYNRMLKSPNVDKGVSDEVHVMHKCKKCGYVTETKAGVIQHSNIDDCTQMADQYKRCSSCELTFHGKEYFSHIARHKQPGYRRENFKITVFPGKRNATESPKYVLYQCELCKRCVRNIPKSHVHSCKAKRQTCKKCGLTFSKNFIQVHKRDHEKVPQYSINNIRLVQFNPRQTVDAAPVKVNTKTKYVLYQCKVCAMNMVSVSSAMRHSRLYCNSNASTRFTCAKCGLCFFHGLKSAHARMHVTHPTFTRQNIKLYYFDDNNVNEISKFGISPKNNEVDVPEPDLVKMPERGVFKPYMFFQCQKCLVVLATKASSGRHLTRCKNKLCEIICPVCKYRVHSRQITNHLNAHKEHPDMTRDNIEILKFTDRRSLMEISSNVVPELSKTSEQPVGDSEYKFKLYQCTHCSMCFHTRSFVKRHYVTNCKRRPRAKCRQCGLSFAAKALRDNKSHKRLHQNPDYTLDNILIVPFTGGLVHHKKAYPAKFGKKLENIKVEMESDASDEPTEFDEYSKSIYKCEVCEVYFPTNREAITHGNIKHAACVVKSKSDCEICGFTFSRTALSKHNQYHHTLKGFNRDDFKVLPLTPSIKQEVAGDIEVLPLTPRIKQEIADDINDDSIDYNNIEDWKKLYKCGVCDVLFVKGTTLYRHCSDRHTTNVIMNIRKCPHCDLPFSSRSLKRHLEIHHEHFKLCRNDFTILENTQIAGRTGGARDFLANLEVVTPDPLDILDEEAPSVDEPSAVESFIVHAVESDDV